MAKQMSPFMSAFKDNLASGLAGMSGLGMAGGPMSGIGVLKNLMGGSNASDGDEEQNPGQKMFGMKGKNEGFLERFGGSLSDQLFQRAMMGFMGRG